jgi:hypothetical protein
MADFDWAWPRKIDRQAIEELFTLACIETGHNAVIVGPNCAFRSTRAPGPAGLEQPFRRTRALPERSDECPGDGRGQAVAGFSD